MKQKKEKKKGEAEFCMLICNRLSITVRIITVGHRSKTDQMARMTGQSSARADTMTGQNILNWLE